jgi:aminoglycoside 3-N-acetyltransferase
MEPVITNTETGMARLSADLRALGIAEGDTVLVHASFKSLGPVPGGPETVVRGFLQAVGGDGTLLMPALSWRLKPPEVFDPRTTPSIVGALPEFFRTLPGTHRSVHPSHSVCATGPKAEACLGDHHLDTTPCGPHSPFRKIVEWGGKIVFLGCGLEPNTAMHALEEYVQPAYLFGPRLIYTLRDWADREYQQAYTVHGFVGWRQRYDRVATLVEAGAFLRSGRVLAAQTFVLDAAVLGDAVLRALRRDPLFFVEKA